MSKIKISYYVCNNCENHRLCANLFRFFSWISPSATPARRTKPRGVLCVTSLQQLNPATILRRNAPLNKLPFGYVSRLCSIQSIEHILIYIRSSVIQCHWATAWWPVARTVAKCLHYCVCVASRTSCVRTCCIWTGHI